MDETGECVKANEKNAGEGIINGERSLKRAEGEGQEQRSRHGFKDGPNSSGEHLLSWNRTEREKDACRIN